MPIYCQEGSFDEVQAMSEADRLAVLHDLHILDTEPEAEFDAIVNAAAMVCGVPMCLISLIDRDRHWFKANVGLPDMSEAPRGAAICDVTILQDDLVEVPDCRQDNRFAQKPMVSGEPNVRFYAGIPLSLSDGSRVGCFCVLDNKPGSLTKAQRDVLRQLSLAVSHALESRRTASALLASESRYRALLMQQTSKLARVGGWELDLLTDQVTWSAQTCLIHGLPAEYQPQRDTATRFYTPDSRKQIRSALDSLIRDGIALDMELQLVRADGRASWVRVVGDADWIDGKAVRLRGAIKDIDENIRQRLALESAHERITIATDSGEVGVWEWNISANTLEWTPQMFKLYGIPATDELLDFQVWVDRLHPHDRAAVLASLDESVKERGSLGPAQVAIGAVQLCVTAEDVFVLEHPLDVALMLVAVVVPETIGAPHTTVGAYRKIVDAQSEVSIIGNDRTAEIHIEPERADIERFLGRPSEAKAVLSEGEIVVHPTLEDTIGATGRVESDMTLHAVPLVLIEDTITIPQHELTAGTWLIEVIGVVPELDLVRLEVTESGRLEQHTGRPPRVRFRRRVAAAGSEVGHSGETGQLATGDWLEIIESDPIAEPGLINIIGQLP